MKFSNFDPGNAKQPEKTAWERVLHPSINVRTNSQGRSTKAIKSETTLSRAIVSCPWIRDDIGTRPVSVYRVYTGKRWYKAHCNSRTRENERKVRFIFWRNDFERVVVIVLSVREKMANERLRTHSGSQSSGLRYTGIYSIGLRYTRTRETFKVDFSEKSILNCSETILIFSNVQRKF